MGTQWHTWGTFENELDHTRFSTAMSRAYTVFLVTAYPPTDLVL